MTSDQTFSLLVPCYNAERYVEPFLKQLKKLKVSFNEVIFYDDASTDETAAILKKLGCRVIIGIENKGPGYARNRLAEAATGNYIHFHDIDDEFNPSFLHLVKSKLDQNPADVLIGYADWVDSASRHLLIAWRYDQRELENTALHYLLTHPLGVISTVYKKESFEIVHGFNELIKCWEDTDLHIRLANAGAIFAVIDEVIAYSIRHNNGISKNQGWCWECRMKFLQLYANEFSDDSKLVIGKELENTAYRLFSHGKFMAAFKAFHLGRAQGFDAPTVNNKTFNKIKNVSPLLVFIVKSLYIEMRKSRA